MAVACENVQPVCEIRRRRVALLAFDYNPATTAIVLGIILIGALFFLPNAKAQTSRGVNSDRNRTTLISQYRQRRNLEQTGCECGIPHGGISCDGAARLQAADRAMGKPGEREAPESVGPDGLPQVMPEIEPGDTQTAAMPLLEESVGFGFGFESAAPNLIGDFFGGSGNRITIRTTVPTDISVVGVIANNAAPGSANAILIYEAGTGAPNDFTSIGIGIDTTNDGLADTFSISEPLPPNDSPVAPGPGFVFDGGTAVFVGTSGETTAPAGAFSSPDFWRARYSFSQTVAVDIPAGGGASVRRMKLAENNSPIPRDRIFGLYNFFNDVPNGFGDVSRYALGLEKTFFNGAMSVDVRFPFAATLASDQMTSAIGSRDAEIGNSTIVWKNLLWEDSALLVSAGMGVTLPTAEDTRLFLPNGQQILHINNDASHLLPFVAFVATSSNDIFVQAFGQLDIDPSGNEIVGDPSGATFQRIGTLQDATLLFLDLTVGTWLYRNPYARTLTGVAPVVELHYSSTLQDTDSLAGNGFTISSSTRRFDVLNATVGTHLFLGDRLTITPGLSFPLRDGDDEQFDCEAVVQANWYF